MGAALDLATGLIEDRAQVPSRAYRPTVILVSDGQPTDDWQSPLKRLLDSERASKAARFAMGVGDDADTAMLSTFLDSGRQGVPRARGEADQAVLPLGDDERHSAVQRNPDTVIAVEPTDLDEFNF